MAIVLIAAVAVVVYLVSLRVFPWWTCSRCKGSEVRRGRGLAHGRCRRCDGAGRYPRTGVRVLMPGRARDMIGGGRGRHY
jgi:DnaJ-class molecular chaperone